MNYVSKEDRMRYLKTELESQKEALLDYKRRRRGAQIKKDKESLDRRIQLILQNIETIKFEIRTIVA